MKLFRFFLALLICASPTMVMADQNLPYWASIGAGKARMRTGPGQQFPATWLYQRAGLPVKVIATYPSWRKIQDPDGTIGWMQANLISQVRTAMVLRDVQSLHQLPSADARIVWRVEPGVIGKISDCADGWCKFDVSGRIGYISTQALWGIN